MLTSRQNVPHIICMQISLSIIEEKIKMSLYLSQYCRKLKKNVYTYVSMVKDHNYSITEVTTCVRGIIVCTLLVIS